MPDEPVLHPCDPTRPVPPGTPVPRLPFQTIDVHCHLLAPSVEALVAGHPKRAAVGARDAEMTGAESVAVNQDMFRSVSTRLTNLDQRLSDMDAMGVDIQAVSPSPTQYYYWAEPDLGDRIAAAFNGALADVCSRYPDRLVGLGTVSLQEPARAAQQLDTAVRDLGLKGVEVSSNVNGLDLADPFFDPFWRKADELGAVVFIHPLGTTLGTRLAEHYLVNSIGQPLETTICLSKLIFSGALDRFPGVKIIAAHGGGYLPTYVGRSNHANAVRPEATRCSCRPSDYFDRIWFDSVVYDADSLARLIDSVGVERVVIGTDYPFDMGHYDPAGLLASFDAHTQQLVLGANAAALLGLERSNA